MQFYLDIENRPYWVTPEMELQARKTVSLSKLQAVKDLRDVSPLTEVNDPSSPTGKSLRPSGLKELKDYVDQLLPITSVIGDLEHLVDVVEDMRARLELITKIEIVNLLDDRFPDLSPEQRVKAATDWDYLKTLIKNTKRATDFGI
jgi:hypothetical protein